MLVLSRKIGQSIDIGNDITVTLVRIGPNQCRIGITAPGLSIVRSELLKPYLGNDTKPARNIPAGEGSD